MGNAQVSQGFINAGRNLCAGQGQVLQAKGHFVDHTAAQDLALGVLQDRAHDLGDEGQWLAVDVFSIQDHPAVQLTFVTARDQSVEATDKGGLATAAGPGHQQDFTGLQLKGDVAQRIVRSGTVAER